MSLVWQVEEVALNVRPSPVETYQDGWLIRASGGTVRRTNCISPTPYRSDDFTSVLAAGEALYHRLGRPTIIKILSIGDDVDEMLADRGYTIDAPSQVLLAPDIASRSRSKAVAVETGAVPADWIEAWMAFGGSPPAGSFLSASLSAITLPAAYASYRQKGEIVALAYGIIHRGILGIDAVATRPDARGRGLAGQVVSSLQNWAHQNKATSACLSVLADNPAAHALYRRTGFVRHLYDYHYRLRD